MTPGIPERQPAGIRGDSGPDDGETLAGAA